MIGVSADEIKLHGRFEVANAPDAQEKKLP
jgi:hypothetical protein